MMENLIGKVSDYVSSLLTDTLSSDLLFHNVRHTYEVVAAVQEIGNQSHFTEEQMNILVVAAWFHDCGYTVAYSGHEQESKRIAKAFLETQSCDEAFINAVQRCIDATKFPQRPATETEQALCDADLYHFTKPGYASCTKALRHEFKTYLALSYSDEEWVAQNCALLQQHRYFTGYGQNVLQKFKQVNIDLLSCNPRYPL